MKTGFLFGCAVALACVSCSTVRIQTVPENAMIEIDGKKVDASKPIRLVPFKKYHAVVSQDKYVSQSFVLSSPQTGVKTVVLERIIHFDTVPSGVTVTNSKGLEYGVTPCDVRLPADAPEMLFTLRLAGYVSKTVSVSPITEDTMVREELLVDGPGRSLPHITFTASGYPKVVLEQIEMNNLASEDTKTTCVWTFEDDVLPESIRRGEDDETLMLSVLRSRNTKGIERRYANLECLNLTTGQMQRITSGDYFEHHGVVVGEQMYFISMKTGRADLWLADFPMLKSSVLYLTNRFVKSSPDCSPDGTQLLLTGMMPTAPADKKVLIMNIEKEKSPKIEILCDGYDARWSPDGSRILFLNGDPARLFVCGSDGAHKIELLPADKSNAIYKDATWTADGMSIVFASNRENEHPQNFDVWRLKLQKGAVPERMVGGPAVEDCPVMTQDGKNVLFRSNRNYKWGIWKTEVVND